ncbi:MAG: hypothetical protein ACFC1C_02535 [Candidatus Malihini olakiniferum]
MKGVVYSNQPLPELAKLRKRSFWRIANRQEKVSAISIPAVTDDPSWYHDLLRAGRTAQ